MEIQKYLKDFEKEICECGKEHLFTIARIVIEKGAIEKLPELVKEFKAKKAFCFSR